MQRLLKPLLLGACFCLGCGPAGTSTTPEPDRPADAPTRLPVSAEDQNRLVELVKETPHEEYGIPYKTWMEDRMAQEEGGVLFQDWSVTSRGGTRYEVRFIYTVVEPDARSLQKGYSWNVEGLLNVVSAPRELTVPGRSRAHTRSEPTDRRSILQDQTYSLE